MPSSDPQTIPKVLKLVELLQPKSIVDVGCGNGRYGFLFREVLDLNYGRLSKSDWIVTIDSVEVDKDYISPIHEYVYNNIHVRDWLSFEPDEYYDVAFMGDVLEHFDDGYWQLALSKARDNSMYTVLVCPNWSGSIEQGDWHGHISERHKVVLSPSLVGGRCISANSKYFISVFDNNGTGILDDKSILE